jgi:dihydrofolate reductase
MRKIILYIASSLDGYIARKNGDVDWLFTDADYGYTEFLASVDATLMGHATYKQVLTFGEFPYKDKLNYVFTRQLNLNNDENVEYVSGNIVAFTQNLKAQKGGNIWLIGGSQIINVLLRANLVDEIILSIHPIILGSGIPLFAEQEHSHSLELTNTMAYPSGLVQVNYRVKR